LGWALVLEVAQHLDDQGAADAVIERLGQVGPGVGQHGEAAIGHDGVAVADAGGHDLGPAGRAEVDVHVLLFDHLVALVGRQQVGRLGADDAQYVPLVGLDQHALAEQHLVPPAAEGQELDEAVVGNVGGDEADLVHVAGEHDLRPVARLVADEAAELVLGQFAQRGHVLAETRRALRLRSRARRGRR
jgi:hypothetical protein